MYMTVSKLSRQTAEPCTDADWQTILPAMPSHSPYRTHFESLQNTGKVIYRAGSINVANELETVTLYLTQQDYEDFKLTPEWAAFEADILSIYNPVVLTEETI